MTDEEKERSMPPWTVEEANEEVRAMIQARREEDAFIDGESQPESVA